MTASIDVMIPFWGDPDLLMESIASVRAQTNPDWRLVVVDDCYPVSVADRIAALGDDRISYVRNDTNLGTTGNYRRCVELSTAPLVVLFGCDDLMHPTYVDLVLKTRAAYPQAAAIQVGIDVIDSDGAPFLPPRDLVKNRFLMPRGEGVTVLSGEPAALSLLRGVWIRWPSLAFDRRTILDHPFREDFPIIQDLAILIDIILDGGVLVYVPELAFSVRRHRSSTSATSALNGTRFSGERRYLALADGLMRARGWHRAARAAHLRLLSRLDAASYIPGAIQTRSWGGLREIVRHITYVSPPIPDTHPPVRGHDDGR